MPQRTYWHLLDQRRVPTEYEVVSTQLHYYTQRGFEVSVAWENWCEQYQRQSPLRCADWERFVDPRQTTYTAYTGLQSNKETFVDGLFEMIQTTDYDRKLDVSWVSNLGRLFVPLSYLCHGFQMVAAYIGHLAPSGRITLAAMFQAADEIRRIQRIAYRRRQLQLAWPGFDGEARSIWQTDPVWQPMREVVERLLVTYDWGEAFTALNLVFKPVVDELFMVRFGDWARNHGDYILPQVLYSLDEDCQWHRQWSQTLARLALEDTPANETVLREWIDTWYPLVHRAASPLADLVSSAASDQGTVSDRLELALNTHLDRCGLARAADLKA